MGYERELEKEKFICKLNRLNAFDLIIEEAYLEDREEEFTFTGEYDKLEKQKVNNQLEKKLQFILREN